MKVILRKIFYFLPFVFTALAMIMMVHLVISLKNKEIPSVFNREILYVLPASMEDTIMAEDLIIIDTNEIYNKPQTRNNKQYQVRFHLNLLKRCQYLNNRLNYHHHKLFGHM
jgi:hypothetical protein